MNFVQPIRDPELIREIRRFPKEKNYRNYMMFENGINSGLRISDILQFRVSDTKRPYFDIVEKKTKKKKRIEMTPTLRRLFKEYIEGMEDHEFLFTSREVINKPISRSMAYKILREAAEHVGLEISVHIRLERHSVITTISNKRMWPCSRRYLITRKTRSHWYTSVLTKMKWIKR